MENNQGQVPPQFQVEVGEKEAEGIYSNIVFIAHSPSEVILDFARALPGLPKARVYARIVMTPQHAKMLLGALEQNLRKYEAQFGAIKVPGEQNPAQGHRLHHAERRGDSAATPGARAAPRKDAGGRTGRPRASRKQCSVSPCASSSSSGSRSTR